MNLKGRGAEQLSPEERSGCNTHTRGWKQVCKQHQTNTEHSVSAPCSLQTREKLLVESILQLKSAHIIKVTVACVCARVCVCPIVQLSKQSCIMHRFDRPQTQNKFTRVSHEVSTETRGRFHLCQRAGGSGWINGSLFILSIYCKWYHSILSVWVHSPSLSGTIHPSRIKETSTLFRGAKQRLHQDISSLHHFMPSVIESIPKSTLSNQQILEFIREMIMSEKVKELHVQMNEAQWRKTYLSSVRFSVSKWMR